MTTMALQGFQNSLIKYYHSYIGNREINWKAQLGEDINWGLSFDYLKEADTETIQNQHQRMTVVTRFTEWL